MVKPIVLQATLETISSDVIVFEPVVLLIKDVLLFVYKKVEVDFVTKVVGKGG